MTETGKLWHFAIMIEGYIVMVICSALGPLFTTLMYNVDKQSSSKHHLDINAPTNSH